MLSVLARMSVRGFIAFDAKTGNHGQRGTIFNNVTPPTHRGRPPLGDAAFFPGDRQL